MGYGNYSYSNVTLESSGTLDGNLTVMASNFTSAGQFTLSADYTRRTVSAAQSASYGGMAPMGASGAPMGALNASQSILDYIGFRAPPSGTPGADYSQTITYTLDCG
jgi:hypothetical protein